MKRGTSSVAHGPESHDGAAKRGGSVSEFYKEAPTTLAAPGDRLPVSAPEVKGYKERPRAVDWKRQGTARQDASRYDEKVEVSGSEGDVARLKATGRPCGNCEPRCACLDMHVEPILALTPQVVVDPLTKVRTRHQERTCEG
ncbi:unnamed protein product [Hyaloperonospora brassicae]|uniref:Uncharacterized protein n=1 Tax=Hyaloperonospora brassicae TaxID=162125 RepID=A0AAV0SYX4_HYABA|nr:unnamed protein product [Hyaloperonospora brassicae]